MRSLPTGIIGFGFTCILAGCLAVLGVPLAAADPLSLSQALKGLATHPRPSASQDLVARFPQRPSLYLDCHRLAFNDSQAVDADRHRPNRDLVMPLAAQQMEVMERFFDVLLADASFASESEAMAVAYVQFDRARTRRELGQFAEPRVLELEVVYQDLLHRRTASELSQQLTRLLLAQALGRSDDPPRDLEAPVLPVSPETIPDVSSLLGQARAGRAARALAEGRDDADRTLVEQELKQQLAELLLRLRALDAAQQSARTESAWRDLKLDESRTLYDQEVAADLGYSMSQQTRARMLERRIGYCQALTWAELNALIDRPVWALDAQEP